MLYLVKQQKIEKYKQQKTLLKDCLKQSFRSSFIGENLFHCGLIEFHKTNTLNKNKQNILSRCICIRELSKAVMYKIHFKKTWKQS